MSAAGPFSPARRPWIRILLVGALASAGLLATGGARAGSDPADSAGGKGAQMYCFMRGAGNSHDVSWTAAYALIKRQSASLFKTSPEHAAVMITEAVVQNPGSYPDCGKYLGSLFEKAAARDAAAAAAAAGNTENAPATDSNATKPARGSSRYSY
ncbi:MAG: hypothetical protein RLZZ423_1541 [Cyanobacteriota bacterium]|jgi:hypothetical protein